MAIASVAPPDPSMRFEFENVDLQAPLGLLCEDIEVTIEAQTRHNTWQFTMSSVNPRTPAKRNLHGQGIVSFAGHGKLQMVERLAQRQMQDFNSCGTAEMLLSRRAYGLFSRVVTYKDFLRGITSVAMDGSEAVGKITLPANQPAQEESTTISFCEAVAMDNFIQVLGLLINTSDMVGSNEVMVCTGLDHGTTTEKCDMKGQSSWTVHAAYTPIGPSRATGDVLVFCEDGSLAAAFTGCQFTKLEIGRLERALGSVNGSLVLPAVDVPILQRPHVARLDSIPPLSIGSDTSSSTDSGPASPGGGEDTLVAMLEKLTGVATSTVLDETLLDDLGIDSLAAIELSSELAGFYQITIDGGDLVAMTVGELRVHLKLPPSKMNSHMIFEPSMEGTRDAVSTGTGKYNMDGAILALIAETTGVASSTIGLSMTLEDLGLDSLALIELCSGLSRIGKLAMQPEDVTLDLTVGQVVFGTSTPDSTPPITSMPTQFTMDVQSALAACNMVAEGAAKEHGFQDYWTEVAPQQDRLAIAYILEALRKLGIDLASFQTGVAVPEIPHLLKHARLGRRIWDILASYGIVKKDTSGGYVAGNNPARFADDSSDELDKNFVKRYPRYAGEARLMRLTGTALAECLTGEADAVKLLFGSEASSKALQEYYGRSPMLSFMTSQLATFVVSLPTESSGKQRPSEPFHILEVGAGTGGTTGEMVKMLQHRGLNVTYTFTDISKTLVAKAKRRFAQHSEWMSFEHVDLERPVAPHLQGKFHVVFATNCVHATKDRVATCSRIREMVTPDGLMILSEVTRIIPWYDIVFGLLDGWWFSPEPNGYPLQSAEQWMVDFKQAGFPSTACTSGSTEDLNTQQLLIGSNVAIAGVDSIQ